MLVSYPPKSSPKFVTRKIFRSQRVDQFLQFGCVSALLSVQRVGRTERLTKGGPSARHTSAENRVPPRLPSLESLWRERNYVAVRRYATRWATQHGQATTAACVPLSVAPGEAYQFC